MATHAESLRSALASAYRYNPEIEAERANLRAINEGVPIAKSGYRPNISASADAGAIKTNVNPGQTTARNPSGYQLSVSQNLFDGFRTRNALLKSEANVRAARASLHAVEQSVLLQAVTAYMNVVRDQAIVRLREANVRVLSKNLSVTRRRFKVGEVTRTDVAQSRARRAGSISDLDLARSNLRSSRANYVRIVGHRASRLRGATIPQARLPRSLQDALRRATNETPAIISALYLEQAARHNVDQIAGELLPSLSLSANYRKRFQPSESISSVGTSSIIGLLRIPIYAGGSVHARTRQAKHLHIRQIQLVAQARTQARERAVSAWAALGAARAQLLSDKARAAASETALSGVQEEEQVGQRTLLDLLNAQQELLNARVALVATRRDIVVNAYALMAATGRLTAKELNLSDRLHDPEAHYLDVRRKWFGISITHRDGRREKLDLWRTHGARRRR